MKYCFIANPHARNGRSHRVLAAVRDDINRRQLDYQWVECASLDHARRLSADANHAGYDVVVAAGGDGTINRVMNGFFDADGRRLSAARFGVLHVGTSPDFCRSYGVPTEIRAAIQTLLDGQERRVAVGHIVYGTGTTGHTDVFGCCANVGLGAAVARRANSGIRRYAGDFLGTFLSLLRTLCRHRPRTLRITLDGEERIVPDVLNLAIGRTRFIASGLKVHHELRAEDPRMYVLTLRRLSWRTIGPVLWSIYCGHRLVQRACLSLEYAHSVTVASANGPLEVEFDGDPAGVCPCRITTAPEPLNLIVGNAA